MKITLATINKVFHAKKSSAETMALKGYTLIDRLFVDSSGLGSSDELALTKDQFLVKLTELLKTHYELTAKIIGEGQFQVYVGLFKKTARPTGKIINNNTLENIDKTKRIIRLYDTNIITFEKDKITLDSGGFNTRTTTARMNEYLTYGSVYRKNWELIWNYKNIEHKFSNNQLVINLNEL